MKKPLVVIDIPNGKAMAQIARHLGYGTETIEQFRGMDPEHFPTYIEEYNPKNDTFWGSNMAWVPEYRYNHVMYEDYIKEHNLKAKEYTKKEIQKWVKEQITGLKEAFDTHFPEESFRHYIKGAL